MAPPAITPALSRRSSLLRFNSGLMVIAAAMVVTVCSVFSRDGRVGNLYAVAFVQRHDQFQGIYRVQSQAARPEERLLVAYFLRCDLQHQVFDQKAFDLVFSFGGGVFIVVCGFVFLKNSG